MTVHFVITGGTIDSFYDGSKDTAVPLEKSVIPKYIELLKLQNEVTFTQVCMKDSRQLVEQDLHNVLNAVEESPHKHVIITHGTYTMPDSARFLKAHLKRNDQTIVFTASMIPLTGFSPSDAGFNLGFAYAKVLDLEPGIYVCVNGTVFAPEEVAKLISEGRFVSVFGEK